MKTNDLSVGDRVFADGCWWHIVAIVQDPEEGVLYGIADSPGDCPQRWGYLGLRKREEVA